MHLVEGRPQGAVCVSVQFLIFGESEERPVTLALGSGIQIPERMENAPRRIELDEDETVTYNQTFIFPPMDNNTVYPVKYTLFNWPLQSSE